MLACRAAVAGLWVDDRDRFRSAKLDEEVEFLGLDEDVANALVLVLEQLPEEQRLRFAERFFARRSRSPSGWISWTPEVKLRIGAAVVLLVLELTGRPDLERPEIVDLLVGAAQGDDPSLTPEPVLAELRKSVARIRLSAEDDRAPSFVVSIAVAEVIDPSGGEVDVYEVLARSVWAAGRSWGPGRLLRLMLAVDRIFAEISPAS